MMRSTLVLVIVLIFCGVGFADGTVTSATEAPAPVTEGIAAGAPLLQGTAVFGPTTDSVAAGPHLQEILRRDARQTKMWWYGWLAGFSALTAGQATLYLTSDDEGFKADQLVGGVGSVLGIAGVIISPVSPYDVTGDPAALLADRADREREGRGWVNHALGLAVNSASGLVLWLHYDRPGSAVFTFVAGTVIAEAQIFTVPTVARDAAAGEGTTTFSVAPGAVLVRRTF